LQSGLDIFLCFFILSGTSERAFIFSFPSGGNMEEYEFSIAIDYLEKGRIYSYHMKDKCQRVPTYRTLMLVTHGSYHGLMLYFFISTALASNTVVPYRTIPYRVPYIYDSHYCSLAVPMIGSNTSSASALDFRGKLLKCHFSK